MGACPVKTPQRGLRLRTLLRVRYSLGHAAYLAPPRSKKPKSRGYESNATQLLQATPSARALQSARVEAEVRMAKKTGRLPTAGEVQERYPFTSEAAEKLIRATKRALAARSKVAAPANQTSKTAHAGPFWDAKASGY